MLTAGKSSVTELFEAKRKLLLHHYEFREATQLVSILIEHYTGLTRKDLIIEPQRFIDSQIISDIDHAVERLLKNEPVQYITGIAHFCGNEFRVNPDVLIPRPETEELVRWVLDDFHDRHHLKILDIGTGSGCIAISLWLRLQDAYIGAWDISESALKMAARNNHELSSKVNFKRINFLNTSAWPVCEFDVVISNPPYIPVIDKDSLPKNVVDYEPHNALFTPGHDPILFYRVLAEFGINHMKENGIIYCELHENYARDAVNVFRNANFNSIELRNDLNGKARMLKACK